MAVGNIQYKKTKIGQIPEDWDVLKIGNVVQKASQRDPRKKPSSQFKYVDISSISNDLYKITDFQILTGKNAPSRAKKVIKLNDIIYATVRPYLKRIAIVPQELDNEICSTGFCVIRCDSKPADYRYIFYILLTEWLTQRLTDLQKGSSYPAITDKDIYSQFIPLPHISEQRKIVEVLSTVDADIEKTDAIIKETQQLKKGLMEKFFKNKAYCSMKLAKLEKTDLTPIYIKDLGKIITGTTPSTKVDEYYNSNDYMFVGPSDLGLKKIIEKSDKYISEKGFRVSRQLPQDTVMVVCIGATIGKVGLTSKPCATNQQINSITPKKDFPADYIYYLMSGIKKYLLAFSGDTATPILNKGDFGKVISFVHRSFEERETISNILSETDEKIENEQNYKSELEQLKKGLLQVLLTGKVRVKV